MEKHKIWQQKNQKSDFYKKKKIFNIGDADVNKIFLSKIESHGINKSFKYFAGYNVNDVVRPFCLKLSKMTSYIRKFKENITMSLRVNDKQLFKNYNKKWKKTERLMSIDFESKSSYDDDNKYIKTKVKIFAGSVITNFHNKKYLKKKYRAYVYQ